MSVSESFQQSTSTPTVVNIPQSDYLFQLAQYSQSLAQNLYNWAQQTYAQTSQITDQMIGNFINTGQLAGGLAANNIDRYINTFQPLENELISDAHTYASPARIAMEMGRAESDVGQAFDAARRTALEDLKSYGIDPSAGRYAGLDRANLVQEAAAKAGAGNVARENAEAKGRALRSEAIQIGERYPFQALNALNTGVQAYNAAEQAALANANTGQNLMQLPLGYLNNAMSLKYPPMGQTSQSTGGSRSSSGGGAKPSNNKQPSAREPSDYPSIGGSGGPRTGGGSVAPAYFTPFNNAPTSPDTVDLSGFNDYGGMGQYSFPGGSYDAFTNYDPTLSGSASDPYQQYFPTGDYGSYTNYGYGNGADYSGYDPTSTDYNSYDNFSGWGDTGSGFDSSGYSSDYGGYTDTSGYDSSSSYSDPWAGWDTSGYSADYGGYTDTSGYDSAPADYGLDYSSADWGDYAAGGPVGAPPAPRLMPMQAQQGISMARSRANPRAAVNTRPRFFAQGGADDDMSPTTGGAIPDEASPSGGAMVDDVNSHTNTNEFVIPRDVALWKGQEFFQNLITKSRQARMSAPAKPQVGPPQQGRASFASRPLR